MFYDPASRSPDQEAGEIRHSGPSRACIKHKTIQKEIQNTKINKKN